MNTQFVIGQIVKIHPACDLFMRGVQHAEIVSIGRYWITVQANLNGRTYRIAPQNLITI